MTWEPEGEPIKVDEEGSLPDEEFADSDQMLTAWSDLAKMVEEDSTT